MFRHIFTTNSRNISLLSRIWNGPNKTLVDNQTEQKIISILRNRFPQAEVIEVVDLSGGCGAMFEVHVTTPEFKGLNTVKQHREVIQALKEDIKDMHGIRIHTSVPV